MNLHPSGPANSVSTSCRRPALRGSRTIETGSCSVPRPATAASTMASPSLNWWAACGAHSLGVPPSCTDQASGGPLLLLARQRCPERAARLAETPWGLRASGDAHRTRLCCPRRRAIRTSKIHLTNAFSQLLQKYCTRHGWRGCRPWRRSQMAPANHSLYEGSIRSSRRSNACQSRPWTKLSSPANCLQVRWQTFADGRKMSPPPACAAICISQARSK